MSAPEHDRPVAVVSGGSRGLGLALVRDLLDRGYTVATFSRTTSPELSRLCVSAGPDRLIWSAVDGGDAASAETFVRAMVARHRRVDVLVNNAAVGLEGLLTLTPVGDITDTLRINLVLPVVLARACLTPMLARRTGVIVNLSSINASRGHPGVAVYSAAKAALEGLTRSLAREVGPAGIRVVGVAPGFFDSDMTSGLSADRRRRLVKRTPLGRLGTTADIVAAVAFLISPAAGFVTGQTLTVDGGYSC